MERRHCDICDRVMPEPLFLSGIRVPDPRGRGYSDGDVVVVKAFGGHFGKPLDVCNPCIRKLATAEPEVVGNPEPSE